RHDGGLLDAAGEIQVFLRPRRLSPRRSIIEHIAAIEHEAGDLQHGKAADCDDDDRNDADVTKRFHAARPPDLRRSENACAAAATAFALDGFALPAVFAVAFTVAFTVLGGSSRAGSASMTVVPGGRAAIAILESRRTTWSHSESWRLRW